MQTIEVMQGTDWDRPLQLRDDNGDAITAYLSSDTLAAQIWAGDDQGVLATPVVAWADDDAATGRIRLTISRDDIAPPKIPGLYKLIVTISRGDRTKPVFRGYVKINPGPGTGLAPKAYTPAEELAVYFSDVEEIQDEDDQAGFAEQREKAWAYVNGIILAHWDGDPVWLRSKLESGALIVTPEVSELAAKRALALILAQELPDSATVAAGRKSAYQQAGREFAIEASILARQLVAEIDTDGDGRADLRVDCSSVRSRRG